MMFRKVFQRQPCLSRSVMTWSPLASAFNTKPSKKIHVSFTKGNVGLFKIPELVDYTGFYLLKENVHNCSEMLINEAISPDRSRKMIEIFDELSDSLCRVADMADFVRVGHPEKQISDAANEACHSVSVLVEKLNTNVELYRALKHVGVNGDKFPTDSVDVHTTDLMIMDFEMSGIHLDKQKRKKFVELNEGALELGNFFNKGCQSHTSVPKSVLPKQLQDLFAIDGDNIILTGPYSDNHRDVVREAAYKIFYYPNPHQENLLQGLISTRNELAQTAGFQTFGHRATVNTLGKNPESVKEFLDLLSTKIYKSAVQDFEILQSLKSRSDSNSKLLQPWDVSYFSGIARHNRCKVNSSMLAPYFSLGSCMEGLDNLFQRLFGVSLIHEEAENGEVWHHSVHKVVVEDEEKGPLGYIYCDFFERMGKSPIDCHFTIRGGRQLRDGSYQLPIVCLNLNFPSPTATKPSLLTPSMVENLFHEFGHALHSMLSETKYQHVNGTRCSTDFAEVPSVLMEYYASDPRVLSTFARHYKTGEKLSYEILEDMCNAKHMFEASEKQLQIVYSMLDQRLHGEHPLNSSTSDVLADVFNQYYHLKHVPNTAWQQRFSHLVGYGARYYSYVMSLAVASRIWNKCFKADPFDRTMGTRYRREILRHGGGVPPNNLIGAMLNETPTMSSLVQCLADDIAERQDRNEWNSGEH